MVLEQFLYRKSIFSKLMDWTYHAASTIHKSLCLTFTALREIPLKQDLNREAISIPKISTLFRKPIP